MTNKTVPTTDLRARYAEAATEWALKHPIAGYFLADGDVAQQLAKAWGEQIARFLDEAVRDDEMAKLRQRAERAETEVDRLADYGLNHRERAERAEATVERVRAFVDELRSYCSPHGIAAVYAKRLEEVLNGGAS